MNIDSLTLGQIKEIQALSCGEVKASSGGDFVVGETVLIRTVTMFWVGTVTKAGASFVTLEPAAWVADTGRYHDALTKGALSEIEPAKGPARVAIGAIVDVVSWSHAVPTAQK
jgi:hypothetical protein